MKGIPAAWPPIGPSTGTRYQIKGVTAGRRKDAVCVVEGRLELGGLSVAASPDGLCGAGSPGLARMDGEVAQKGMGLQGWNLSEPLVICH